MVKEFLLPSFKVVFLIEGNTQAGVQPPQQTRADGEDAERGCFPGAEQPWEATGLGAGLCFPAAEALTVTQS